MFLAEIISLISFEEQKLMLTSCQLKQLTYQLLIPDFGFQNNSFVNFDTNNVRALQTDQNGYIEYSSSDERLKTKTKDISDGLSLISQLKPKYFTWKDDEDIDSEISTQAVARKDGEQIGLYAQEVASAIPQASKGGDKDKLWQNYDDRAVMAVMIKAIQELSSKVEALEKN